MTFQNAALYGNNTRVFNEIITVRNTSATRTTKSTQNSKQHHQNISLIKNFTFSMSSSQMNWIIYFYIACETYVMYSTTISWKKNVKSFKHQQKQLPYVKISLSKVQLTTCEASTGTSALLAWAAWMEFLVTSGTSTPTAKMSTSSLKDKSAAPEADLDVSR